MVKRACQIENEPTVTFNQNTNMVVQNPLRRVLVKERIHDIVCTLAMPEEQYSGNQYQL